VKKVIETEGRSDPAAVRAGERDWFATCPRGVEGLLAAELATLGASATRETVAGCHFTGPLAAAYRACLWSRLANRILFPLAQTHAADADTLYAGLQEIQWDAQFDARCSFAIDFSGQNRALRNTQFGAQRSKDAIVDWFARHGERPRVERADPDIRLNLHLSGEQLVVALDLSGGSLHRRGYRARAGAAPLKENLAAALLLRADWPGMAARGGALIDPMCGAGTLLLEGAMMAADIAPALGRRRFGFEHWRGHNPPQWQAILADARGRAERGRERDLPEIRGYDADPKVVHRAQENIARAGLQRVVRVSCKSLAGLRKPTHKPLPTGLLICNPPYGERLGSRQSLHYLYAELGQAMAREFAGWRAAVFTADIELGRAIGLRSNKRYKLYNGALPAILLLFELGPDNSFRAPVSGDADSAATVKGGPAAVDPAAADPAAGDPAAGDPAAGEPRGERPQQPAQSGGEEPGEGARMFANRIRKNRRRLARWLAREQISCYRLYDADMPEYAVAIDVYDDHLCVAEYKAPAGVAPAAAARRLRELMAVLPEAVGIPAQAIVLKQRRRQRGRQQYEKTGSRGQLLSVSEGPARLLVNLHDYLDTGLFLDHRPLRRLLASAAAGKDFLNLFCYTGSATVQVALAGARSTTSVDLSKTYLEWLRKNLAHNGLGESRNILVQADCLAWLKTAQQQFDLILLDPPSFSNSSRMQGTLDVQRDHAALISAAMRCLRTQGTLYFSNNRRGFKLDPSVAAQFQCVDISARTIDPDFERNPRIHRCWEIRHPAAVAGKAE
jgi:23S rRNA (guanine2445-N2)-methyltransferase / 23S rRNA (guanine2069-N7)-methyltransferase